MSILHNLFRNVPSPRKSDVQSRPNAPTGLTDGEMAINRMNLRFGDLQLKRCRYGWMLFAGPFIGKCFELYGEYSEAEVEVFRQLVRPGDVVIDVGANIGDLTLPLAGLAGPQGRVVAYESNPETFNILCANLALNRVGNVRPFNCYVAERENQVVEDVSWGRTAYVGDTWEPAFTALDDLQLDRLRLIKVDVDGNELGVLKSATNLINRFRPVLYFENDLREKSAGLLEFVLASNYRVYFHSAPIFRPDNYFQNPVNAWTAGILASMMMLAIPREMNMDCVGMKEAEHKDDWWD